MSPFSHSDNLRRQGFGRIRGACEEVVLNLSVTDSRIDKRINIWQFVGQRTAVGRDDITTCQGRQMINAVTAPKHIVHNKAVRIIDTSCI